MQSTSFNVIVAAAPAFVPEMVDNLSGSTKHEIETARLYMRAVNKSDLIEFIELLSDPAVMRFIGIDPGYIPSMQEIEQLHSVAVQVWEKRGYGRWSLFDKETNEFIGFCGFRSEQGKPELLCVIHERFWGRELGAEASRACLKYAFEHLGFTEVNAYTRPDNFRARHGLKKIGAEFVSFVDFHGVEGVAYRITHDSFMLKI